MATIKKAQMGKDVPKKKAVTEMGNMADRKEFLKRQSNMADAMDRQSGKGKYAPKANPAIVNKPKAKAKSGGSFPDLNKDGKITKADILKGRGVIAKKGAKVGCASCGKSMKKK